jgi:hypothetical protein
MSVLCSWGVGRLGGGGGLIIVAVHNRNYGRDVSAIKIFLSAENTFLIQNIDFVAHFHHLLPHEPRCCSLQLRCWSFTIGMAFHLQELGTASGIVKFFRNLGRHRTKSRRPEFVRRCTTSLYFRGLWFDSHLVAGMSRQDFPVFISSCSRIPS